METKVVRSAEEFYSLKEAWQTLEKEDPDVTYYGTYDYVSKWVKTYGEDSDKQLFLICVLQSEKVVGIAPFCIETVSSRFVYWKELKFMGQGDYLGVLLAKGESNYSTILKSIFDCIEENNSNWDRLRLTHIREDSLLAAYLFKSPIYNNEFEVLVEVPRLHLSNFETVEDFNRSISKKTRNYRNKLSKEIGYRFEVVNMIDETLYGDLTKLHTKEQIYLKEHKNRVDRRTLFSNSKRNEFLSNVTCYNSNVFAFLLRDNNGKLISYTLSYVYKGVMYSWNSAYDPDYASYRLSKVRYYELFCYLIQNQNISVFDFGAGRYPWKFEWTSDFLMVYQLDCWRESSIKAKILGKLHRIKTAL